MYEAKVKRNTKQYFFSFATETNRHIYLSYVDINSEKRKEES